MSEGANMYDASHIEVLEGWEAIRRRPGMYIGSTGERGLHEMVFTVAERPVNEVLAGRAGSVDITLMSDGGVRVTDDGPGVPVQAAGEIAETGVSGGADGPVLEELLTQLHTRPAHIGRHTTLMGLFGIGPCVTNALSSRLTAEVRRDGVRWVQEYVRGVALTPPAAAGPTATSGTTVTFQPDADIFDEVDCSFTVLAERFRELAFLNRTLDISLTDERPPSGIRSVRFRFPGGARDFVAFLDEPMGAPVHPDVLGFEREDPRMAGTVEVALRWCASREERVRSFANGLPTPDGGTHAVGFREGLAAAVNAYARERRLLKAADADLHADRIGEGLTAVVSVKQDRPEFLGARHASLGAATVGTCVEQAVREHLGTWLREHPEQAAAVIGRIVPDCGR